jgi:hypothetical protein
MASLIHTTATLLLLILVSRAGAQGQPSPTGHWEGTVQIPGMELMVEVDLEAKDKSGFAGTFGQPVQGVKGLPLSTVVVDGKIVRFVVRGGEAPATFEGLLSDDGTSITGKVEQGGQTVPFTLTRKGEARIAPPPVNGPIGKELEGSWNGTIEADGRSMRVVLKMSNQPDGKAIGTIVSPDGSGVEIPIAITQKGLNVTIGVPSVGAGFVGTLNAEATELAGLWSQGPVSGPLTFHRAK